jgi:hypothetical protein
LSQHHRFVQTQGYFNFLDMIRDGRIIAGDAWTIRGMRSVVAHNVGGAWCWQCRSGERRIQMRLSSTGGLPPRGTSRTRAATAGSDRLGEGRHAGRLRPDARAASTSSSGMARNARRESAVVAVPSPPRLAHGRTAFGKVRSTRSGCGQTRWLVWTKARRSSSEGLDIARDQERCVHDHLVADGVGAGLQIS